jgi:hypothetical protein
MKNQIVILALSILPLASFGQSKFSVGVNANAQWSFMNVVQNGAMFATEKGGTALGYAFGLQVQYDFSENWFLRSGAGYQVANHLYRIEGLQFATDIMDGTTSRIESHVALHAVGIPLDLGYRFPLKGGAFSFLLGASGLIAIHVDTGEENTIYYGNGDIQRLASTTYEIDASLFSAGLFTGMEMGFGSKLVLGVEPNIRYTPNTFTFHPLGSRAKTAFEAGLTLRIRVK